jgi:hypothetical protein
MITILAFNENGAACMDSEQMQPATGGSKEQLIFFVVQKIAGAMYCPYLSKKQQKRCFDTQKSTPSAPLQSRIPAAKKQHFKRLTGRNQILTLKPHN